MKLKINYIESEKFRSLCMKQLGILLGSPVITILFNLLINSDFTIDLKRVTISLCSLILSFVFFNNSYNILINLDKRINHVRS